MTSRNDKGALVLVGTAATIGILVLLTLLLQPAPQPVAPEVNIARSISPPASQAHAGKIVTSRHAAQSPKVITPGTQVAADLMVLMALGVLALLLWVPFRIRRWKIESRARYQARGWLSAKDSHDRAMAVRRIQPPF